MLSITRLALLALASTSAVVHALPSPHVPSINLTPAPIADRDTSPSSIDFLASVQAAHIGIGSRQSTNATKPLATVEMCTGTHFTGQCYNATWPTNTCIALRGYAGVLESFLPVNGFSCLLMQGKCNAAVPYAGFSASDPREVEFAQDLPKYYTWIKNATSYMCYTERAEMQRFIRMARLRVASGAE